MKNQVKILIVIGLAVVVSAIIGASYYRKSVQSERKYFESNDSPLVRPDSQTLGPANAKITLVEFLDPECESCSEFNPRLKRVLREYNEQIRLVVRYMPLHTNSVAAAVLTEAAGEQGKYWEMQDLLFQRQAEWGAGHGTPAAQHKPPSVLFEQYGRELGLDLDKLKASIAEPRHLSKIERDKKDGQSLGVTRTPTFFVNGRQLYRFNEWDLKMLIDEELAKE
jgi:protein-disulfide isomerase